MPPSQDVLTPRPVCPCVYVPAERGLTITSDLNQQAVCLFALSAIVVGILETYNKQKASSCPAIFEDRPSQTTRVSWDTPTLTETFPAPSAGLADHSAGHSKFMSSLVRDWCVLALRTPKTTSRRCHVTQRVNIADSVIYLRVDHSSVTNSALRRTTLASEKCDPLSILPDTPQTRINTA